LLGDFKQIYRKELFANQINQNGKLKFDRKKVNYLNLKDEKIEDMQLYAK
jgi:hypothetical protein